ncbi:hypothetical protein AB1Y20_001840 [Prymnesium parvum]|uniref:TLC domain-containing protein n=1 Tax=Prymnesium parvum TaxID=97485 RepID=A0AB34KEB3_PRYPA
MPPFSPPSLAACAIGAAWLGFNLLLSRAAARSFGRAVVDGTPLWRSASGLGTSLLSLPLLFAAALSSAGGIAAWSRRCAQLGLLTFDWAYFFVFGGLMLVDFAQGVLLTPLLRAHHAVCLCCHLFACLAALPAFPHYFAGVVALELGSAATCAHALRPVAFPSAALLGVMSASNLAAALCTLRWHAALREAQPIAAWGGASVSAVLMLARQRDALQLHAARRRRSR